MFSIFSRLKNCFTDDYYIKTDVYERCLLYRHLVAKSITKKMFMLAKHG